MNELSHMYYNYIYLDPDLQSTFLLSSVTFYQTNYISPGLIKIDKLIVFSLFIVIIFVLAVCPLYDVPPYKIHALLLLIAISIDIINYR
jgi:hypothetical protein